MEASTHAADLHDVHEAHHEHELSFWQKYIFSTDHKVIGIQYGVTALLFLAFGFVLMMMMRWQLAYPGHAMPGIGNWLYKILGPSMVGIDPNTKQPGVMMPDLYNSF